jgi:alpha-tubulin suppressor-like RCC1 family protein
VANRHTCGLTAAGEAWCWGQNDHGQLGSVATTALSSQVPVRAAGTLLFNALATGYLHTCGVSRDGQTYCWGDEPALGSARTEGPQATVVAGGHAFTSISAGDALTCGLTGAGLAYCWGQGGQGQLGNGGMADVVTPVAVAGGKTFRSISAGHFYACALDTASKAWCWGLNVDGNLGTGAPGPVPCGDATCASSPLAVAGDITFSSLDAGNWVTCGISTAQRAYCWGRNTFGGIGNGKVGGASEPAPAGVAGAPQ